jgi:pyruvate kinase
VYEDVHTKSKSPFAFAETVASNIAQTALDLKIGLLIVFTETGKAARILAKYRPRQTIYVCTASASVRKQMNLVRGVVPFEIAKGDKLEDSIQKVIRHAKEHAICAEGTKAIVQTST